MTPIVLSYLWHQPIPASWLLFHSHRINHSDRGPSCRRCLLSACVLFEVCLKCCFPRLVSLLCHIRHSIPGLLPILRPLICHVCYVASILHATFYKQTLSPTVPSLWALFFTLGLSTFCPSPAVSVTSISLTSASPLGLHPAPPSLCLLHQTTLPSRSIICLWTVIPVTFSFYPLCLFLLRGAQPLKWICNSESERALCGILNPEPQPDISSSTESVYLRVTTISDAAGCICSPHFVPRSHLIVLTTAAWWWESGNYILQCVIPTRTPQSLSPHKSQLSPKIAFLSAASLSVSYLILNVDDILTLRLSLSSLAGVTRATKSYLTEVQKSRSVRL